MGAMERVGIVAVMWQPEEMSTKEACVGVMYVGSNPLEHRFINKVSGDSRAGV